MTPEEAYEMTERKWKAIAGGELSIDPSHMPNCGLCLFAHEMAGIQSGRIRCHRRCPVPTVFGTYCYRLDWLQEVCVLYDSGPLEEEGDTLEEYLAGAREVLEQLTIHKDQLIAEMERIRGEK
jgi:hypothetical protein